MANRVKVIRSVNNVDASLCVDVFVRGDGTWGFERYRRDFEEGRWFPVSDYRVLVLVDEADAWKRARAEIAWLDEDVQPRPGDQPRPTMPWPNAVPGPS